MSSTPDRSSPSSRSSGASSHSSAASILEVEGFRPGANTVAAFGEEDSDTNSSNDPHFKALMEMTQMGGSSGGKDYRALSVLYICFFVSAALGHEL